MYNRCVMMRRNLLCLGVFASSSSAWISHHHHHHHHHHHPTIKQANTRLARHEVTSRTPSTIDNCVVTRKTAAAGPSWLKRETGILSSDSGESSDNQEKGTFSQEFLQFGVPPMPLGGEAVYEGYGGEYPNQEAVSELRLSAW